LNIRIRGLLVACGLAAGLLSAGCRQDMHDQPRFKPYAKSDFFADKRSARPLVDGTIARGHLREDAVLYTGKAAGKPADAFPFPVTADVMARGRERFDIFCSPCHGRTGAGDGMIVQRGYRKPPTFHQDRLRQAAPGYTYDVITNGFGAMPDYAQQIPVRDRWAIVAYITALQRSQHAAADRLPAEARAALDAADKR
jgi:mono/diheme cytochrome c family protein